MGSKIKVLIIMMLIFSMAVLMPAVGVNAAENGAISLDTQDADIRILLSSLARTNRISLIIGDSVQGTVTINLIEVPPLEAIRLILSANGFVMEKVGNSVIAGKPEEVREFLPRASKVIALQHASATDLAESLSGVVVGPAEIKADPRTNSIIITGTESGINELEQVVRLLDIEIPAEPEISKVARTFPLKYAQASALQESISGLTSSEGKVSIDDRTNSLIITDKSPIVEQLAEVIAQLDIETPYVSKPEKEEPPLPAKLHTQVFSLNHIEANAIKDILQEMLSPEGRIQAFVRQKEPLSPVQTSSGGSFGGQLGGGSSASGMSEKQKWSDLLIVTDVTSVLENIGELISELDTKGPQVKIETKVVEINLSDAIDLGIDWQATHSPSGSTAVTDFPTGATGGIGLNIGTFSEQRFEDILIRVQALETQGKAKIMFQPSVITLDNEMAQMVVVDKIPVQRTYETEFRATTGFEFIDVGISLTVIPHISEDGYIIMDTMPQIDSIKDWTRGENPQPIIASRVAHSRVRVKDGETFAISGLIKEEESDGKSAIPILGRIPLLGRLFGSSSISNMKTDLVIFITPTIYKDNS